MDKKTAKPKKERKPRTPKPKPAPKIAEYNEQGKEICPACKERKFKIIDCSSPEEGKIRFDAQCPCGHKFHYLRDVKSLWQKRKIDGPIKNETDKLHKLPEPGDRSAKPPRRGLDRPKRQREK